MPSLKQTLIIFGIHAASFFIGMALILLAMHVLGITMLFGLISFAVASTCIFGAAVLSYRLADRLQ